MMMVLVVLMVPVLGQVQLQQQELCWEPSPLQGSLS
jgi:hypothetical protein